MGGVTLVVGAAPWYAHGMDPAALDTPIGMPRSVDRRQISVLFTDMVGYTAIVERLGEEDALAFTQAVYTHMTHTVEAQGGAVRGFAGDSIMALFGIPDAQEDAALRACRAAATLHEAFRAASETFRTRFDVEPVLRVGICSGAAVMAAVEGQGTPLTAVGSTVNLASRIQALAPEGGTLICDATQRLVRWVTELEPAGDHAVKGLDGTQTLWRLDGVKAAAGRFDASIARGLSAFVGRDAEAAALHGALARAGSGFAHVDLVAEAGLGKTRLVYEFIQTAKFSSAAVLKGHCIADGAQTPYLPFIEIVKRSFGLRDGEDADATLARVQIGLGQVGMHSAEAVGLLLNLLGRTPPDGVLDGLDGVLIGLRTRDLLARLVTAGREDATTILLVEDIHWIDEASEALLQTLAQSAGGGLLLVTTRRPYYAPDWLAAREVTTLALKPLPPEAIGVLACSRLGVDVLPDALAKRLAQRTGGNPLFGEELLNFLLEEGALRTEEGVAEYDEDLAREGLPASMQSLIAARIEQLTEGEREVLRVAAVVGRRFDTPLLRAAVGRPEALDAALRSLLAHDLIRPVGWDDAYIFRHSLIRETLYANLVSERRARLHLDVARAIEASHPGDVEDVADLLAYHYTQTDQAAQAFRYNAMAGARSANIFSLTEADGYFDQAFRIYEGESGAIPDGDFAAFAADYAMCASLSLRAEGLIAREPAIRAVLDRVGATRDHVLFLHYLSSCHICTGRYREARGVMQRVAAMAASMDDPMARAYALVTELAVPNYTEPLSDDTFEALIAEADALIPTLGDAYLDNFYPSQVLWRHITRGLVGRADATVLAMLEAGEARDDPRSLGYALAQRALIAMLGGNYQRALDLSERALTEARTEWDRAAARSSRVSARIALGKDGAMEEADAYLAHCRAEGWHLYESGPDSVYGLGLAMRGEIGAGLRHIEAAIARREAEGYLPAEYWSRLYICEIYLAVLSGEGDASAGTLIRNLPTLVPILVSGRRRVRALVSEIRACPHFVEDGYYTAHCELILGLLEAGRKPELSRTHLLEARRIVAPWGASPMLERIDAALAAA